jgi:hypothetical protein
MVRIRLDAYIRTIVVLTCGKLTCESRTCPLKMRFTYGQFLSCGRGCVSIVQLVTTAHLGRGDLGMVVSSSRREYILVMYAAMSMQH